VSDQTVQPTLEEHLGRSSRQAEEIRGRLETFKKTLKRARLDLPIGILEGLRQLSGTLQDLKMTVEDHEQERRNLQALAEIGQVVNSSLDLNTVLNEVMDTIIRLTGAQRAFLMMGDARSGKMETKTARNWERMSLDTDELEISDTIIERVVSSGDNALTDPRFDGQESVVAWGLRSILCVPLKVKGKLTGVIYADNRVREGLFTEKEHELLSDFSNQAAVALENARLFDSVKRTLDEVTELKNLMEDVFASIASGVLTADVGDIITLCNKAAEDILAAPKGSLLGTSLQELLEPLSSELPQKVEDVEKKDERYIGLEIQPELEGRGPVDLTLNISPLKTADQETRGVAIVLDDLTEKRRLEAQHRLFERMVSPAVIDQLDPDSLQLGGRLAEISTLFADIRGFTTFSESTDPETLVNVLNRFLAAAAEAILQEEGTIDKFLGDAIMAWYNAPIPQSDHTLRAVRSAITLREAVSALHDELPPEFRLSFGVGIHYGEALMGLVGTQRRLEYTAVGDSVNTAKRLQENAAEGQILISLAAAEYVRDQVELKEVPSIKAEGKEHPIDVLEVIDLV
jgi:class 3 adenylate cyclase/GAF domain-containing protein